MIKRGALFPDKQLIKNIFFLILSCLIPLTIAACASPGGTFSDDQSEKYDSGLVWPQPPMEPRIQFVRSISGPYDIGIKQTWLQETINTIFGRQERHFTMLRPYGVFTDDEKIYITDPGISAVHIFNLKKKK